MLKPQYYLDNWKNIVIFEVGKAQDTVATILKRGHKNSGKHWANPLQTASRKEVLNMVVLLTEEDSNL